MRLQGDTLRAAMDVIVNRWPRQDKRLWADGQFVIACDGHMLVAVPRESITGEVGPIPDKQKIVSAWLKVPQPSPRHVPSAQLRAFALLPDVDAPPCKRCRATGVVECDKCDGSGEIECTCRDCGHTHDSTCYECDDGQADCPDCSGHEPRYGSFLSHVLNTVLLGDLLRIVADERDIAVSVESIKKNNDVYVFRPVGEGPQWVGLIMPMAAYVEATVHFEASQHA